MKFHQLLRAELEELEDNGFSSGAGTPAGASNREQKALQNLYARAFRRALRRARGRGSRRAFL